MNDLGYCPKCDRKRARLTSETACPDCNVLLVDTPLIHKASEGSLKRACYVAAWPDRCEEMRRYGLMHGMLQGLRYCVDQETRAKIDRVLLEFEKPHNVRVSESGANNPKL